MAFVRVKMVLANPGTQRADGTAESVLREALEANGHRFTDQRAAVYRFLLDTAEHPTADEVFTAVRGEITDISLATVYKALETLVGCGLASKLTYGDGSARYDPRTDDHCHARCLSCGAVRDVPEVALPSLPRGTTAAGFEVRSYRLEALGVCPTCRA
jgi:Fur family transcriptional regulator, peroxide stress response regulator